MNPEEENEDQLVNQDEITNLYGGSLVEDDDHKSIGFTVKDVAKQVPKEFLIGLGGTYGDLAELAGLNRNNNTKAQQSASGAQFELLDKMEQSDYEPSVDDIYATTESDFLPSLGGLSLGGKSLPTSKDLREVNDAIGGPGDAETNSGRYLGRSANIYGSGLGFGQTNPVPALIAGVGSEAVGDLTGGNELAKAAAEIVLLLVTQGKSGVSLSSRDPKVQQRIAALREAGYSDKDITLAINSAYKDSKAAKAATKSTGTKKAFESAIEKSEQFISDTLIDAFPGIEHGTQHVHDVARTAYGQVAASGANVTITKPQAFLNAAQNVVNRLQNTLGRNVEAQPFIQRLSEAAMEITQYPTAERVINFYQELNRMGNWGDPKLRERLISQIKDSIKDTFRSEGTAGRQLATEFEEVNRGVQRAYQAEAVHDLLQKANTMEGWDFNKLKKLFDKSENWNVIETGLGHRQTQKLYEISKLGKDIKDFDKAYKGVSKGITLTGNADVASYLGTLGYAATGDMKTASLFLAGKVGKDIAKITTAKLAELSLTDPKFQNILIRTLNAVKTNSPQSLKAAGEAYNTYLDQLGIEH